MYFKAASVWGSGLVLAGLSAAAPNAQVARQSFDVSNATLQEINDYALSVAKSRISANSTGCTAEKLIVRKYWYEPRRLMIPNGDLQLSD